MATILVEMEPTLANDTEIANQIIILVATQGNGTLLYPTSFKEEDAVELCIGMGQEHLEGALQLSDTETILSILGECITLLWPWSGMVSLSSSIFGPQQVGR